MDKRNVVLIGMPGAGKSTIGALLAKELEMQFIDMDLLILKREGRPLQQIINMKGIQHFLDIEENVVLNLDVQNHVIATGGSVVYREKAMEYLKEIGIVVYLQLTYQEIERRLRNAATRGIAMSKEQNLADLYNERVILYEKYADIIANCSGRRVEGSVSAVRHALFEKAGL